MSVRIQGGQVGLAERISLVLLVLMLIPMIVAVGPQGLGAVLGAFVVVGMTQFVGPKE